MTQGPVTVDAATRSPVMPEDVSVETGDVVATRPSGVLRTSPSREDHASRMTTCDQGVGERRVTTCDQGVGERRVTSVDQKTSPMSENYQPPLVSTRDYGVTCDRSID